MRSRRISTIALGILLCLSFSLPFVAAAVTSSPGSTTTLMGMPVQQKFTGLYVSQTYDLILYSPGSNVTVADDVESDACGELVVLITDFNEYGSNSYELNCAESGVGVATTFNINNMDIIPWLLPIIIIAVIFSLMRAFTKGF